MEELLRTAATVVTPLVAIAALIVSIWASLQVKRKREFEILLEENRREAAKHRREFEVLLEENRRETGKREAQTRALTERIDREAAKREAQTRALTERIDREAAKREKLFEQEMAKREAAMQALIDRSDRRFDALLARSDELARQSAGVLERVVRNDARLEVIEAARHRTEADHSAPAAVAAQAVPSERRPK